MTAQELEEQVDRMENQFEKQFDTVHPQGFIDHDDRRVCLEAETTIEGLGATQLYLTVKRGDDGVEAFAELYPTVEWEHDQLGAFTFELAGPCTDSFHLHVPFDGTFGEARLQRD